MSLLDQIEPWVSVGAGLVSALCWARAALVKVTREEDVERRKRAAAKAGVKPNLAGVVLDGWDMSATFAAQARWNSAGAACAALAIFCQASGQLRALLLG